jgi:hypothetical protein
VADVFLSYSRKDTERVARIRAAIEDAGFSVFWDRELEGGAKWEGVLERELTSASVVLVLWSRSSVESDWVREEARKALDLGVFVPARIDDVDLPLGFGHTQAYDWLDVPAGSPGLSGLLNQLGRRAQAVRDAGEHVRKAFRLRTRGNFEVAARELTAAFKEFERVLDPDERERHLEAAAYKRETLEDLRFIARKQYHGDLKETLSGLSLLPIVDAVLELDVDPVRALLGPQCPLHEHLATEDRVRVGAVVRPGAAIDNDLLVRRLLKETEVRGGALDLHCFLLIMNTDDPGPGVSFTESAARQHLSARCINWRPVDGLDALGKRLEMTILSICAADESKVPRDLGG